MPIKGLTNRGLALPEIGQIRKGAKKPADKKGPGAELPYFRVEFAEGEDAARIDFARAFGERPTMIRVMLPFDELERVWDPWKEAYTAGRLLGRSGGEYVQYLIDSKTGELLVLEGKNVKTGMPYPHPKDDVAGVDFKGTPVKFKNTGRLKVVVPELRRVAYLTVMTSSTHDIANISDQFAGFQMLNHGRLAGIPFLLKRVPREISTPGENGQRVRRKKYLISIEVDPKWAEAKFGELAALAAPSATALLPSPELPAEWDEDEVEGEEVGKEEPEFMKDEPAPQPEEKHAPEPTVEPTVRKLVYPLGAEAVSYAAKQWNVDNNTALKELEKKNLGNSIAWEDLVLIVNPQPA